ncbi:MAG: hypothetical protein IPN19_01435 [Elusimicrobia bacterium]|nr:hypothetical protein [Elusimicrobiota bacterium]
MNLKRYQQLLEEIIGHLTRFGERRWSSRIKGWVLEIESLPLEKVISHLTRTQKSLFGMGSVADIVITPEAGLSIPDNEEEIDKANDKLISLARALDQEIERLLGGKGDVLNKSTNF